MKYTLIPLLFIMPLILFSQEVQFGFHLEPHFTVVERADFSKRLNGNYLGYVNREVRAILKSQEVESGIYEIQGHWYNAQEIKKEGFAQALPLEREVQASYRQNVQGSMTLLNQGRSPRVRNFPQFPRDPVSPGDRWEAPLSMEVENLRGDLWAEIPLYCGYSFEGQGEYNGRPVYFIKAQYALRYSKGSNASADRFLTNLSGSHVVTITVDVETMSPILMRDNFQEQWTFTDGQTLEKRGFNLTFYKGVSLLNQGEFLDNLNSGFSRNIPVIPSLTEDQQNQQQNSQEDRQNSENQQIQQLMDEEDLTVHQSTEGLTLSLNNLHFLPDQAVILLEDRPLLDRIAQALSTVEKKTFLVCGHTADVGSQESQLLLSLQRAQVVVQELIDRGISPDRFLYRGVGGSEPLADNQTDQGRRINRRVEITLLED
ncbi:MAG: OmpA family protein [Spirochaetaceae bacterium]|jgi:OOP family OmpA-OmpF porin|nr:OmpA family protein [Spirochaetaceae bacterium]